jgi:hypothetical protein
VGHEIVEAYGGKVALCGVVEGISTTNIVASLTKQNVPSPHFSQSMKPQMDADKRR